MTFLPRVAPRHIKVHVVLFALVIVMLYPLLWMVSSSTKDSGEIFSEPGLIPARPTLDNYAFGWNALTRPFWVYFLNSAVLCALAVTGNLVSCSVVAFAFARLRFFGHGALFTLMLSTIMLPGWVKVVPQYVLFFHLGWINTLLPLVAPKFLAVDAFFVFLLVQFIRTVPKELDEAAELDGAGPLSLFFRIILPLILPALATTAIFTFIWTWDDFFPQLLYLSKPDSFTTPLALRLFQDTEGREALGPMLAMTTLALVPVFAVFVGCQRFFLQGISTTGLRG
jgi:multiple sugar transport system permease protein